MFSTAALKEAGMWMLTDFLLKPAVILDPGGAAYLFQLSFRHQLVLGWFKLLLHRPEDLVQVEPCHFVEQVLNRFVRKGRLGGFPFCGGMSHAVNPAGGQTRGERGYGRGHTTPSPPAKAPRQPLTPPPSLAGSPRPIPPPSPSARLGTAGAHHKGAGGYTGVCSP